MPQSVRLQNWLAFVSVLGILYLCLSTGCSDNGKAAGGSQRPETVAPTVRDPLPWHGRGVWLAGDTHVHYLLREGRGERVLESAHKTKLDFVATTDHAQGVDEGPLEALIAAARAAYPELLIVAGIEWNIPAGDHATVLVEARPDEWEILRQFMVRFDRRGAPDLARLQPPEDASGEDDHDRSETWATLQDAERGLAWLREREARDGVRSVVYLNHLSRHAFYRYVDLAALRRAGVAGFEAAAGHQRDLFHQPRLHRFDPVAARVGGDWDRLLADGPFGISASSDFHIPRTAYAPGEFSVTHVYAPERSVAGVIEGLSRGATTTTLGGVVSSVDTTTRTPAFDDAALIGETLAVPTGAAVEYTIRLQIPAIDSLGAPNRVDHVEVITNAATGVARVAFDHGRLEPGARELRWTLPVEATSRPGAFYVRARGCREIGGAGEDEANADLCFYTGATRVEVVEGPGRP